MYITSKEQYGRTETVVDRAQLARDVAAIIGGTVAAEEGQWGQVSIEVEGFSISLQGMHGANVRRVRVSAHGPHALNQLLSGRGPDWPAITVSAERSGAEIAADVAKRIMGQARAALADLKGRADAVTARHLSAKQHAGALRAAVPALRLDTPSDPNARFTLYGSGEGASVSGYMNDHGGLYLDRVTVPAEKAAAVLAMLLNA